MKFNFVHLLYHKMLLFIHRHHSSGLITMQIIRKFRNCSVLFGMKYKIRLYLKDLANICIKSLNIRSNMATPIRNILRRCQPY